MRIKENWMTLTESEIDNMTKESWEHYMNGGCVCYALSCSECCCGAWWRE